MKIILLTAALAAFLTGASADGSGEGSAEQKITLVPEAGAQDKATAFVEERLDEGGIPFKAVAQVNIAVDEIFSNIILYSGAKEASISVGLDNGTVTVVFSDDGTPYDPTAKPDPDITLSAEERKIGGLGIFMVKKIMDSVVYEYRGGKNILTLKKYAENRKNG